MGVGFLFTLLLFLNDYVCGYWEQVVNIIAMLSSGVFCSAFVSYLVEISNDKRVEEEKARQRKFIFSKLNHRLEILLQREMLRLSQYSMINKHEQAKEIEKIFEIEKTPLLLKKYIEEGEKAYEKIKPDKEELRAYLLMGTSIYNYKGLLNTITSLLSDANAYYSSNIVCEEDIKLLENLQGLLIDIVDMAKKEFLDEFVCVKKVFFDNLCSCFGALGIDPSAQIKCKIYTN